MFPPFASSRTFRPAGGHKRFYKAAGTLRPEGRFQKAFVVHGNTRATQGTRLRTGPVLGFPKGDQRSSNSQPAHLQGPCQKRERHQRALSATPTAPPHGSATAVRATYVNETLHFRARGYPLTTAPSLSARASFTKRDTARAAVDTTVLHRQGCCLRPSATPYACTLLSDEAPAWAVVRIALERTCLRDLSGACNVKHVVEVAAVRPTASL